MARGHVIEQRTPAASSAAALAARREIQSHLDAEQEQAAVALAAKSLERWPEDPWLLCDLGRAHARGGDWPKAKTAFLRSVAVAPRHVDGWHNLGLACRRLGEIEGAFAALKRALLLNPSRADSYLAMGNLLISAGQFGDAAECFERAARHDPTLAAAMRRLAEFRSDEQKPAQAERAFRQALALDPSDSQGWCGLAQVLEHLGEAEEACRCYDKALSLRPDNALALGDYLALAGTDASDVHWGRAERYLDDPAVGDEAKALIAYGLAKNSRQSGKLEDAVRFAEQANAARRRVAGPLDRAELSARVDRIIATYGRGFFAGRPGGHSDDRPVFVVGMPRSGTTLAEQILAQHPEAHGVGEIPDLARLAADRAPDAPWRAAAGMTAAEAEQDAERYLTRLVEEAGGAAVIVDKSPLNFFHIAFIARLFPQARIVHCRRDARDVALSIWFENFAPTQQYATDLEDLAAYQHHYRRLMAHWHAAAPLPILDLDYADLVRDPETEARRLLSFCGLDWEPACLAFHRSARPVQSPSRWQVRAPIHTKSIGRWRDYRRLLPALNNTFADLEP